MSLSAWLICHSHLPRPVSSLGAASLRHVLSLALTVRLWLACPHIFRPGELTPQSAGPSLLARLWPHRPTHSHGPSRSAEAIKLLSDVRCTPLGSACCRRPSAADACALRVTGRDFLFARVLRPVSLVPWLGVPLFASPAASRAVFLFSFASCCCRCLASMPPSLVHVLVCARLAGLASSAGLGGLVSSAGFPASAPSDWPAACGNSNTCAVPWVSSPKQRAVVASSHRAAAQPSVRSRTKERHARRLGFRDAKTRFS